MSMGNNGPYTDSTEATTRGRQASACVPLLPERKATHKYTTIMEI
jgi:hypothetical protein